MAVRGRTGIFPHRIDATTDAAAMLDYEHKEVHSGDCFYYTQVNELDDTQLASVKMLTVNTTTWNHFQWVVESQASILIEIRETITDNIQPETTLERNRNRNYPDSSAALAIESAGQTTAATGGTVIYSWASGGLAATPSAGKSPGVNRSSGELVLKQNEKYELRVTSNVDDNMVSIYMTWYEHSNIE